MKLEPLNDTLSDSDSDIEENKSKIMSQPKFSELMHGYHRKFYVGKKEIKSVWVGMNNPLPTSYQKTDWGGFHVKTIALRGHDSSKKADGDNTEEVNINTFVGVTENEEPELSHEPQTIDSLEDDMELGSPSLESGEPSDGDALFNKTGESVMDSSIDKEDEIKSPPPDQPVIEEEEEIESFVDVDIPNSEEKNQETELKVMPSPSPAKNGENIYGCDIPEIGERGITLKQLRGLYANVEKRCVSERWTSTFNLRPLKPETVTIYDVVEYLVKPFTKESKRSLVEDLPSTAGCQHPRFVVSHWWGGSFKDLISCLEQHRKDFSRNYYSGHERKGGGMTENTPVWICAFAINSTNIQNFMVEKYNFYPDLHPVDVAFSRALKISKGRAIFILDRTGECFDRSWFIHELHKVMVEYPKAEPSSWCLYTAHQKLNIARKVVKTIQDTKKISDGFSDAVGIVYGGAPLDIKPEVTRIREQSFPLNLILKACDIQVENSMSSYEVDKKRIIDSIEGIKEADELQKVDPWTSTDVQSLSTKFNETIRAHFAATPGALRLAIRECRRLSMTSPIAIHASLRKSINGRKEIIQTPGTLMLSKGDAYEGWYKILYTMSKGKMNYGLEFDFQQGLGWDDLTKVQALNLISHLPLSLTSLVICHAPFGPKFIFALAEWIKRSNKLRRIEIRHTCVGGQDGKEAGEHLADAIQKTKSNIEVLALIKTDLIGFRNAKKWSDVIASNSSLLELNLAGMSDYGDHLNLYALDELSTVEHRHDNRQRIYFADGIFPDAILTNEGFVELSHGLSKNESVETLIFRHHLIGRSGIEAFRDVIQDNVCITKVQFNEEGVHEDEVMNALSELDKRTEGRIPEIEISYS